MKWAEWDRQELVRFYTRLIIEGGEADEHLHVDLAATVDEQPEVFSCEILQGVLGEHIQKALPHSLGGKIYILFNEPV